MPDKAKSFQEKIDHQRLSPSLFDYCFISCRTNLRVFKEFLKTLQPGMAILDAGCGYKPWRPLLPANCDCVGIDYSTQYASPDLLGSVDRLPFADNSFDAVICSEVIEHTRYPEASIQELRRVCKPGGFIYLTTPFAFPEHGIPYDFQRPTQFFYRSLFEKDEIRFLVPTSSTLGTAFVCFNYFIECTPLRFAWGIRHLAYLLFNTLAITADTIINWLAPKIMKSLPTYTHMLPLGYALIIKIVK